MLLQEIDTVHGEIFRSFVGLWRGPRCRCLSWATGHRGYIPIYDITIVSLKKAVEAREILP